MSEAVFEHAWDRGEEEKPRRTSRNRRGAARWGATRARDGPVAVERQPGFRAYPLAELGLHGLGHGVYPPSDGKK